jgi:hypothetical protein
MQRLVALVVVALSCFGSISGQTSKPSKSDAQIRDQIIKASVNGYSGSCPCPYNVDRAGKRCGRRSAYSRPAGASPLCYPEDVTQRMVDEYRKKERNETLPR